MCLRNFQKLFRVSREVRYLFCDFVYVLSDTHCSSSGEETEAKEQSETWRYSTVHGEFSLSSNHSGYVAESSFTKKGSWKISWPENICSLEYRNYIWYFPDYWSNTDENRFSLKPTKNL